MLAKLEPRLKVGSNLELTTDSTSVFCSLSVTVATLSLTADLALQIFVKRLDKLLQLSAEQIRLQMHYQN